MSFNAFVILFQQGTLRIHEVRGRQVQPAQLAQREAKGQVRVTPKGERNKLDFSSSDPKRIMSRHDSGKRGVAGMRKA